MPILSFHSKEVDTLNLSHFDANLQRENDCEIYWMMSASTVSLERSSEIERDRQRKGEMKLQDRLRVHIRLIMGN